MTREKPSVFVLGTGGTITMDGPSRWDLVDYAHRGRRVGIEELVSTIPELERVAQVTARELTANNSLGFTSQDWLRWAETITQLATDEQPDGFVIVHGTASLEEAAYFLSLVLKIPQPVVFVGAQRPFSGLSSDGFLNLYNGVTAAASPVMKETGVTVAFNEQIHTARDVTKAINHRVEAFQSRTYGPVGYVESGGVVDVARRMIRRYGTETPFELSKISALPRVDIAYSYAEADGTAIDAFIRAGAQGVVCAGFAPGRLTPAEEAAASEAIANGIAIVQASRSGAGRVLARQAAAERGFILANDLIPQKARILLALALTQTRSNAEIQALFDSC